MRKHIRFVAMFAIVAAFAVLAAGCGSKKSSSTAPPRRRAPAAARAPPSARAPTTTARSKKGGIYRVGWEQSFGFTDNFDPTGEYLGNAWGLYSNLLIRSLVGYKHQPGAAGNELIGDLATDVPTPTDGGMTYTYKLRDRHQVRPAGQPRGHLEGRRLRDEPARQPEGRRRSTPSTTRSSRAGTPSRTARRRRSPASRRRTTRRSSST